MLNVVLKTKKNNISNSTLEKMIWFKGERVCLCLFWYEQTPRITPKKISEKPAQILNIKFAVEKRLWSFKLRKTNELSNSFLGLLFSERYLWMLKFLTRTLERNLRNLLKYKQPIYKATAHWKRNDNIMGISVSTIESRSLVDSLLRVYGGATNTYNLVIFLSLSWALI